MTDHKPKVREVELPVTVEAFDIGGGELSITIGSPPGWDQLKSVQSNGDGVIINSDGYVKYNAYQQDGVMIRVLLTKSSDKESK